MLFRGISLNSTVMVLSGIRRTTCAAFAFYPMARMYSSMFFGVGIALFYRAARQNTYNMLWAALFGFATLNILGLAARRMEPRRGLSFGELMAIMTVLLAVFLLGWEMLNVFHVFPLKLK
jgi:hypothetical protein